MIPEDIINILTDNQDLVANEIDIINKSIERIIDALETSSSVISQELLSEINSKILNVESENKKLNQSQMLRTYARTLHKIEIFSNNKKLGKELSMHDIIVLKTIKQCSNKEHEIVDVLAKIPVLYSSASFQLRDVRVAYCKNCKQYYMLKKDFDNIGGVILCQVIDETKQNRNNNDDFKNFQEQSVLFKCGYNVSTQKNISEEMRHIILSIIIESKVLTISEISDHLNSLIKRGSKIPSWKDATSKWQRDLKYIEDYDIKNIPEIIYDKIILKYTK